MTTELRAHLVASRMFVLPSVTRAEAFGYVQLEAMACGRPVISTALPTGVPWVNETGLVVPPSDVEALRRAIERLAADPALAARLGAPARRARAAEFSMGAMGDRLVAVCHELAGVGPEAGSDGASNEARVRHRARRRRPARRRRRCGCSSPPRSSSRTAVRSSTRRSGSASADASSRR